MNYPKYRVSDRELAQMLRIRAEAIGGGHGTLLEVAARRLEERAMELEALRGATSPGGTGMGGSE